MTAGSFANFRGRASLRPFFVFRSKIHTASMSVTHRRSPRIQMPLGLLSGSPPFTGKTFSSITLPLRPALLI